MDTPIVVALVKAYYNVKVLIIYQLYSSTDNIVY